MRRGLTVRVSGGLIAILASAVIGLAACGSSGSSGGSKSADCTSSSGGRVTVVAKDLQFSQRCIAAPAGQALTVTFKNDDSGTPHDWVLKGAGGKIGSKLINGGETATVKVPPLKPGDYTYVCTVHANMSGTLKVGSASSGGTTLPGG